MRNWIVFASLWVSMTFNAQDLATFHQERSKLDKALMLTLGSWASANAVTGAIGWTTAKSPEMKSFHQMNVMWNAVNLGLAVPGYLKARNAKAVMSLSATLSEQQKTERIFLFNSGLDIAYITAGFLLRSMALNQQSKTDQLNGFGKGLILQGSFLFAFDLTAFALHHRHGKQVLRWVESKQ
ncbi:MAG: hypothetical protein EBV23_13245 [Flavobacteriia bacterium]|nr:hypothetical protein [Flavobacteriia bacterium]